MDAPRHRRPTSRRAAAGGGHRSRSSKSTKPSNAASSASPEREAGDRRSALAASLERDPLRVYLVRDAGVPVATARLLVEDGLAAIHGLGVVPEQRRRRLGAYLTTIVTRAGLALGASLVWLSVDRENDGCSARSMRASTIDPPSSGGASCRSTEPPRRVTAAPLRALRRRDRRQPAGGGLIDGRSAGP